MENPPFTDHLPMKKTFILSSFPMFSPATDDDHRRKFRRSGEQKKTNFLGLKKMLCLDRNYLGDYEMQPTRKTT